MMKQIVFLVIIIVSIIGSLTIFFGSENDTNETQEVTYDNTFPSNLTSCKNLNVYNFTKCLIDYTSNFYIYNITEDWLNLTEKDLRERGGDCHDWAKYYEQKAKENDFYGFSYHLKKHRITIIQDKNDTRNFCVINLRSYKCF